MKKLIFLIVSAAFITQVEAQVIEVKAVPEVVVTTFSSSYPSVSNVQWRKAGNYYVADYDINENYMYITYDPAGKIIETGEGIAPASYPAPMTTYVKTKYKDEKIKRVYKIKDANGKTIWKGKVKEDYIYFDENGNYMKMERD